MALEIDLAGKRALVTGVTSGIGASIAEVLAKAGCDIAGCGTRSADSPQAVEFLSSVRSHDRNACYFPADLADPDVPANLVDDVCAELGGIDILVSNAGRNVFKGAATCSDDDWDYCMNLDLAAHWRLAKAARASLEAADPGVIIAIGSNHAWNTIPGCFPYNVAKAGLLGLIQSLALEWGPKVRAVGIAPGFIDTPANDTWFDTFPDPSAERLRTEQMHPVGRIGSPQEIGALCAFLASQNGAFISGTTLLVDGGRSASMQDS